MPITKDEVYESPRAVTKVTSASPDLSPEDELDLPLDGNIRRNFLVNFPEFVVGLALDEPFWDYVKGIFSEAELETIKAEPDGLSQIRACLLVLFAKSGIADLSARTLRDFARFLKRSEHQRLFDLLRGRRDGRLSDPSYTVSGKDVIWLQGLLRSTKAAADQLKIIIQENKVCLKKLREEAVLARKAFKQAEQAAAFPTAEVQEKREAMEAAERSVDAQGELFLGQGNLAKKRVWAHEERFLGIDPGFLFDCCSESPYFAEKLTSVRQCRPWEPLGPVLAEAIDVGNASAVYDLCIALKKAGYLEAMMRNKDNDQRWFCWGGYALFIGSSSHRLVASLNPSENLLTRMRSKGLMLDYDYKRLLSMQVLEDRTDGLLVVVARTLWRSDDPFDAFHKFLVCLDEEDQSLVRELFRNTDWRDSRAERFNENWRNNITIFDAVLEEEEGLSFACYSEILDEFSRSEIIKLALANKLKKEGAKNGDNLGILGESYLERLQGIFLRCPSFDKICRGWDIFNKKLPKLGRRLVTDDIREYEDEQFKLCMEKSVAVAQVVTAKIAWPIVRYMLPSLFQRAPLIKPFSREKTGRYTGWLLSRRSLKSRRLTTDEPMQAEESPSAPEKQGLRFTK